MSHLHGWLLGFSEYTKTYESLQNLSDRELKDIGLSRCEIKQIASNARQSFNAEREVYHSSYAATVQNDRDLKQYEYQMIATRSTLPTL
jgi:hypothetical protein